MQSIATHNELSDLQEDAMQGPNDANTYMLPESEKFACT